MRAGEKYVGHSGSSETSEPNEAMKEKQRKILPQNVNRIKNASC